MEPSKRVSFVNSCYFFFLVECPRWFVEKRHEGGKDKVKEYFAVAQERDDGNLEQEAIIDETMEFHVYFKNRAKSTFVKSMKAW